MGSPFSSYFSFDFLSSFGEEFAKNQKVVFSGVHSETAKIFIIDFFQEKLQDTVLCMTEDQESLQKTLRHLKVSGKKIEVIRSDISDCLKNHYLIQWKHSTKTIFLFSSEIEEEVFSSFDQLRHFSWQPEERQKISLTDSVQNLIDMGYEYSDEELLPVGTYRAQGDTLFVHGVGMTGSMTIDFAFDEIEKIEDWDGLSTVYPAKQVGPEKMFHQAVPENVIVVYNDVEESNNMVRTNKKIIFSDFPQDEENFHHLRFLPLIPYSSFVDFINDIHTKIQHKWKILLYTKKLKEVTNFLTEESIPYSLSNKNTSGIHCIEANEHLPLPEAFQNPEEKKIFLTDNEFFFFSQKKHNKSLESLNIEFLSSLKEGDYVVHFDNGVALFQGIIQREYDGIHREYLVLEFLGNDRLFVPVENSEKVSRYFAEGSSPRLTRLGGGDWQKKMNKAKKETEKMAKELLELYAKRAQIKRKAFSLYSDRMEKFADSFGYDPTPGQAKAFSDVQKDMESEHPMDRLICGMLVLEKQR